MSIYRLSTLFIAAIVFDANASAAEKKDTRDAAPQRGVKTPGVQIPMALLKSEAAIKLESPPAGAAFLDSVLIADVAGIHRIDNRSNQPSAELPLILVEKACAGVVNAFGFVWTGSCSSGELAKVEYKPGTRPQTKDLKPPIDSAKPETEKKTADSKPEAGGPKPEPPSAKIVASVQTGAPSAPQALAASADSLWLLADNKTSLQRIDPQENTIVGEMRLPGSCTAVIHAENALWVACPSEAKLIRIDPRTSLVEKRIEVPDEPYALTAGDSSIWLLSRKEGKLTRIDPKSNKVVATVDLGIPNAAGSLAFGEGSVWVSVPGFPVTRVSPVPEKERVVQQFHGEGGGIIYFGLGSVWVGSPGSKTVSRYDPKRIAATLAE